MKSIAPVLRQARSEVMPRVPELAPYIPGNSNVLWAELHDAVYRTGHEGMSVAPCDMNKLERQTIAGFLIGEQRELLVEGSGNEAQFTWQPEVPQRGVYGRRYMFALAVQQILDYGARRVERHYTAGRDMAHSWYPGIEEHYARLGQIGLSVTPHPKLPRVRAYLGSNATVPIPEEGQYLDSALRTEGLGSFTSYFLRIVRSKVSGSNERWQAAHDLAYVPLSFASRHFYESTKIAISPWRLKADITYDDRAGKYRFTVDPRHKKKLNPRMGNLPNTTMKCPAHAVVARDAEPEADQDTNLTHYVHAAINMARDYDFF